ncbi:hypothetical protein [Consotaella aegiceratis]|uniref:hypothetical protein n=1 Tax=Consotaella aegiceratis TaxID=3097961 RepID=UPI002F41D683
MEKQIEPLSDLEKVREVMVTERRRLASHMADANMRSASAVDDLMVVQQRIEAIDRAIADERSLLSEI